jgi:hypothetical protein
VPYEDYLPKSGTIIFSHGEIEKEIQIEVLEKDNEDAMG